MKDVLLVIGGIIVFGCFIYGSYWVAKTVSYNIFYEDMITESIKENVKASCLK